MPHYRRKISSTGIYHVVLRGINKQIIFEEAADYESFLEVLRHYKELLGFKLYAYCLMDNHVHLLITGDLETLRVDDIMKRIETKFVRWYNRKYKRCGYLFQNRYKSEVVEELSYFKTAFCYILQNPIRAGIERALGEYKWSSFNDSVKAKSDLVDIEDAIALFGSYEECMMFIHHLSVTKQMEYYADKRIPDEEALILMKEMTGFCSPSDFQRADFKVRNKNIEILIKAGLSVRQISRITGISRKIITGLQKAMK